MLCCGGGRREEEGSRGRSLRGFKYSKGELVADSNHKTRYVSWPAQAPVRLCGDLPREQARASGILTACVGPHHLGSPSSRPTPCKGHSTCRDPKPP